MLHRAFSVPLTENNRQKELQLITAIANNNGIQSNIIEKLITKKYKQITVKQFYPISDNTSRNQSFVSLPFAGKLSHDLGNYFKKLNIIPVFSSGTSIRNTLFNAKEKQDHMERCGLYRLNCPQCSASYIGQTGRSFKTRLKEHLKTRNNEFLHLREADHMVPDTFLPKILHFCSKSTKLNLLESLEINKLKRDKNYFTLNEQTDLHTSPLLNLKLR